MRLDPHPYFTSTHFDDGILPTSHFCTRHPSPSSLRRSGSFPTRSGPPQQASSTPVSRSSHSTGSDPWGASLFLFSPPLSPAFSIFSSSVSCPRVIFLFLPPPCHPCLCFLRHLTLLFFTFVKSHSTTLVMCACVCMCVCVCVCVGVGVGVGVWFMWVCICACICDCRLEYFKSKFEYSLIGICLSIHSCDIGTKESRMNWRSALPRATCYLTRICTNDIVPRQPKGCCH